MRRTIAERTVLARATKVCPKCHAAAGRHCRHRQRPAVPGWRTLTPGLPMSGVHAERLALVPVEAPDD